ncbi:MAG: class I SAM-dependent methyltransferase [Planctomycetes bacterium]|nr:class I SAM-dependent methyltransferase [Planctomycetota bacterium]
MGSDAGHPWYAATYGLLTGASEILYVRRVRRELLRSAAGRVLEIGVGTGANLAHYTTAARVLVATDPDPHMLERVSIDGGLAPPTFRVLTRGERLPFPAGSFDTVVATLVLCSAGDVPGTLGEAVRVLKSGGEFRFIEHVRARNRPGAALQGAVAPVWRRLFGGCRPDRDTESAIRASGLEIRELRHRSLALPIPPFAVVRPHILGVAVRP